ncbi:GerAB/ArcD/ProY family transporter [Paenibacillus naphthalenovorans]|uniref:GerAB/ArcD/ProY family transporter n=1 Tax=Paenibacillus naphthalenovorans TaxID=162209 RepID=UPI003D2B3D4C
MKLSSRQILWLLATFELGMSILLTASPSIMDAKQDAWISFLLAGAAAIFITVVSVKLSLLYPGLTFIEFSQSILGKWLGKIIVIPYFIQWYSVIPIILRQASDFIDMIMFTRTPLLLILLLVLIPVIYVTYHGGIQGIGRCSEIVGPIIFFAFGLVLLLGVINMDVNRVLPVYADSGRINILKGAIPPLAFLGESSTILLMLTCFVNDQKKVVSRALWGVGIASFFLSLSVLASLMTFGPHLSAKMWYPFFEMIRYISFMEFIQNLESIIVIVWFLSVCIKLSVYIFITSYGTAQWLHIRQWKIMIWFVALSGIILALSYNNIVESSIDYPKTIWMPYIFPINFVGIPLVLYIVGTVKKRKRLKL